MPPLVYMQTVNEPTLNGNSNAAIVDWAISLRGALRQANADKKAMQEWMNIAIKK